MTDRELMKWALYALEGSNAYDWPVVEELKERLAQPEQEPVAYLHNETELLRLARRANSGDFEPNHWRPLYTALPKAAEWVGLTDEERHSIREWQEIQKELGPVWAPMMLYLYLAIEQALKEKNT